VGAGFGWPMPRTTPPPANNTLFRPGLDLQVPHGHAAMQLVGANKLDLDAARPEILPGISAEAVSDHHAPGDGTSRPGVRHYKSGSQDDLEVGNTSISTTLSIRTRLLQE